MRDLFAALVLTLAVCPSTGVTGGQPPLVRQGKPSVRYKSLGLGRVDIAGVELLTAGNRGASELRSGKHPWELRYTYRLDVGENHYRPEWDKRLTRELKFSRSVAHELLRRLPPRVSNGHLLQIRWTPEKGLDLRYDGEPQREGSTPIPPTSNLAVMTAAFDSLLGPGGQDDIYKAFFGEKRKKQK